MKVDKGEEHLVIRQSTAVIEELNLQKGDDIQSEVAGVRNFEINKKPDAPSCWPGSENTVVGYPPTLTMIALLCYT